MLRINIIHKGDNSQIQLQFIILVIDNTINISVRIIANPHPLQPILRSILNKL